MNTNSRRNPPAGGSGLPTTEGVPFSDKRVLDVPLRHLVELNPQLLVAGSLTGSGYLADDVETSGTMRETCPHCLGNPLKLVIRRKNVIHSHLFCDQCTRCFDAILPNGRSAFALSDLPIY